MAKNTPTVGMVDGSALGLKSWRASDHLVTDTDIRKLADEAAAHGDTDQHDLCLAALAGDKQARSACEEVILWTRREMGVL